jgi:mRNA-degrading endonuclease YafQ of YafQ-DinJ toxin-antitoxin module
MDKLVAGDSLEINYRNHLLIGNYDHRHECHDVTKSLLS